MYQAYFFVLMYIEKMKNLKIIEYCRKC